MSKRQKLTALGLGALLATGVLAGVACKKILPVKPCEPCCDPSLPPGHCDVPRAVCWSISVKEASAPEISSLVTSDAYSDTFSPSVHPLIDAGGSSLAVTYAGSPAPPFESSAVFDDATTQELNALMPGTSHSVLRPVQTPQEWQAYLDGAPAGSTFDGTLEVRFELDANVTSADAFDAFSLLWDVQGNPQDGRIAVSSATTSLGAYLSGVVRSYMLNLASSDFDANPSVRRNQIAQSLQRVTAYAENGDLNSAMDMLLSDVMTRMDGFYGGDPTDDYVVTEAGQQLIRPQVNSYYAALRDAYLLRP